MRGCGVLLHISSLPGKGGVGTFGNEARKFVDFLADAGQSWWQVLPLTPPARNNSPYSSYSLVAGNPAFVNLEMLEDEHLLAFWSRRFLPKHVGEKANFSFCTKVQLPMLRQTFHSGFELHRDKMKSFRQKNAFWLEDYALFMALKQRYGEEVPFQQWPEPLLLREPQALEQARGELQEEIEIQVWMQYLFFRQWRALKRYANQKGVRIIGDLPFYPNVDSAEVWAHPEVFLLDKGLRPTAVAGVPPDAFTEDGQLWGNPLYNWSSLRENDYRWWRTRLRLVTRMYDRVRIDHFRAFDEYYAIPAGAATAQEGSWQPGPGMDFFQAVDGDIPPGSLFAEDLGMITNSVRQLVRESGLPGMKVLQFAFDPEAESDYLPHNFVRNCVGYTGTHDNDTLLGWLRSITPREMRFAQEYMRLSPREGYHWGIIRTLYGTAAETVIVPMQDFLVLDSRSRMNIPGQAAGNWEWRVNGAELTPRLAARMRELAQLYRRTD